jgi:hypothetical protein
VGSKSISPALIEFSGGINDKTRSIKNSRDIEKLYRNMIKVMKDKSTDTMFCMHCFGNAMFYLISAILYSNSLFCNTRYIIDKVHHTSNV